MASYKTTDLQVPNTIVEGILSKAADTSVIAKLSPSAPQTFINSEYVRFTKDPEAEFVGEGAEKSAGEFATESVVAGLHKAQVTVRYTKEVQFADEDARLGLLDGLSVKLGEATGRALDYGIIHAINPATGETMSGVTALTAGATAATATDDPTADVDGLPDAPIVEGYTPNGIALATPYANTLRKVRTSEGIRQFPEIQLDPTKVGAVGGLTAAVSGTVNGKLAKTATNVLALCGDFAQIKWGIVRDLGIELIEFGDPDGLGDLKRTNEVAIRAEVFYSWAVLDPKAFSVLKSA